MTDGEAVGGEGVHWWVHRGGKWWGGWHRQALGAFSSILKLSVGRSNAPPLAIRRNQLEPSSALGRWCTHFGLTGLCQGKNRILRPLSRCQGVWRAGMVGAWSHLLRFRYSTTLGIGAHNRIRSRRLLGSQRMESPLGNRFAQRLQR